MELDDLKKTWNALNKQLQNESITDENQITELIESYQTGARKSINRITHWQRLSISIGIVAILFLLSVLLIIPSVVINLMTQQRTGIMCIFIGVTIVFGMLWDLRTYRWIQNTRIDEMPIVEVTQRINTYKKWIKYEIIVISVWTVAFLALYYWMMEFYELPLPAQILFITCSAIIITITLYFIYKKFTYYNLNELRKNLDELKRLKMDN